MKILGLIIALLIVVFSISAIETMRSKPNTVTHIWQVPSNVSDCQLTYCADDQILFASTEKTECGAKRLLLRQINSAGKIVKKLSIDTSGNLFDLCGYSSKSNLIALNCTGGTGSRAMVVDWKAQTRKFLQKGMLFPFSWNGNSNPISTSGKYALLHNKKSRDNWIVDLQDSHLTTPLKTPCNADNGAIVRWSSQDVLTWFDESQRHLMRYSEGVTQEEPALLPAVSDRRAVLSPDSRMLAVFHPQTRGRLQIDLYSTGSGDKICQLSCKLGQNEGIQSVLWSEDSRRFVVGLNNEKDGFSNTIYLGDQNGRLREISVSKGRVVGVANAMAWSPGGRELACIVYSGNENATSASLTLINVPK